MTGPVARPVCRGPVGPSAWLRRRTWLNGCVTETERAKVGQALDLLRDSLYEHVDTAMVNAYGPQWDERVADENAKHRSDGRRWPVSKTDLAVMLKVIQHEKIAPWWSSNTRGDPRIRSFASEILTLRNLFSHGDECIKEHARLLDTASRLLQLLGILVPVDFEGPDEFATKDAGDRETVDVPEVPPVVSDLFDSEIASLGEPVKRLGEMATKATNLDGDSAQHTLDAALSSMGQTEPDLIQPKQELFSTSIGEEAFSLLDETYLLEADGEHDSTVQKVLIALVRSLVLDSVMLISAMVSHVTSLAESSRALEPELKKEQLRIAVDRSALLAEWSEKGRIERARELVQLAHRMSEGSAIASSVIIRGNGELRSDPTIENDEAVRLLRDSSARARMLAAMAPGTYYETWVVMNLRDEGKLCNDLGRSDEAIQAFARAAEIIDRYPAADPDLM